MPKPKQPVFRKLKPAPPEWRALIKKQNQQELKLLTQTARLNAGMAKQFAVLLNVCPEDIPANVRRRIQAETKRVVRALSGKAIRKPKR